MSNKTKITVKVPFKEEDVILESDLVILAGISKEGDIKGDFVSIIGHGNTAGMISLFIAIKMMLQDELGKDVIDTIMFMQDTDLELRKREDVK